MKENLEQLHADAIRDLFGISSIKQLDEFVVKYFDKKKGRLVYATGVEADKIRREIWHMTDVKRRTIS